MPNSRLSYSRSLQIARKDLTRRALLIGSLAWAGLAPIAPVRSQSFGTAFPRRPLTLVVPFSPGGPVDVLGRLLAHEYQARTGQTATVENRTGGAGNIGIEAVLKSDPDGTTLLLIPAGNLTINPTLMAGLPFDVERDLAPISILANAPNAIVASPQLGIATIADLIARARTQKLSYGSPGVGSQLHLAMELLKEKVGIDILHVPYRGTTQALSDLLGDHIDLLATNLPGVLSAIRERQVVPLAMTTAERSPLVPNVPTLRESGIEGIDVTSWYGLLAPRRIPNEVRDAIFEATRDILMTTSLQEKLAAQGLTVMIEPHIDFSARVRRETDLWARVIKSHNITSQ